jgi:hypothetical protein
MNGTSGVPDLTLAEILLESDAGGLPRAAALLSSQPLIDRIRFNSDLFRYLVATARDARRTAHNPEVAGSNPAPASHSSKNSSTVSRGAALSSRHHHFRPRWWGSRANLYGPANRGTCRPFGGRQDIMLYVLTSRPVFSQIKQSRSIRGRTR